MPRAPPIQLCVALGALGAGAAFAGEAVLIEAVVKQVDQKSVASRWQWAAAKPRMALNDGEFVRTGADARVELRYPDGTLARLAPTTTLQLQPADVGGKGRALKVLAGKIWMKVTKGRRDTRVYTPSAVATIVGTEFVIEVTAEQQTICTVLEGAIDVSHLLQNIAGQVTVTAGTQTLVAPSAPPVAPLPVNVEQFRQRDPALTEAAPAATVPVEPEGKQEDTNASQALDGRGGRTDPAGTPATTTSPAPTLASPAERTIPRSATSEQLKDTVQQPPIKELGVDPGQVGGSPTTGGAQVEVK